MSISKWECDEPGCRAVANGVGPARGLLAIGWQVIPGARCQILYCPAHRRDPVPCREQPGRACSLCRAEQMAAHYFIGPRDPGAVPR